MDIKLLVKITSRAWALDILAQMHRGVPGRQATLLAAIGAGRTAFGASLAHLMALGLIARNPGHGHPLRPEFVLTEAGAAAAATADAILTAGAGIGLLRKSWTVPVLALAEQPQRFSGFKAGLGAITDRALSGALQKLEAQEWVARQIDLSARVPFPTYQAVNSGHDIATAVALH